MKNVTPVRLVVPFAAALILPTLAHAHSGHALAYDCASGVLHPFHGWDHLLAMIAVGILAAQLGGRARWLLPAAFLGAMTCAAVLGARGLALPGTEMTIAASVLVLGLLIAAAARLPLAAITATVALFALAHGFAHGAEMPAGSAAFSYGAGFVLSTALLHALGLLLAHLAGRKSPQLPRVAGAACAAVGTLLLIA